MLVVLKSPAHGSLVVPGIHSQTMPAASAPGTGVALGLTVAIETAVDGEGWAGGVAVGPTAGVGDWLPQPATVAAVMRIKSTRNVDDTVRF
jgi:hypothetical protein